MANPTIGDLFTVYRDNAYLSVQFADIVNAPPLVTQPQFDNTVKAATDEFVQRALGNMSAAIPLGGNTVLTPAAAGKLHSLIHSRR